MEKEMRRLSRELAFEEAARVRDRIIAIRKRLSGEDVGENDADVALAIAAVPPRRTGPIRNPRRTRRGP
jgi:excinuclease UvrABC nuclease subunit